MDVVCKLKLMTRENKLFFWDCFISFFAQALIIKGVILPRWTCKMVLSRLVVKEEPRFDSFLSGLCMFSTCTLWIPWFPPITQKHASVGSVDWSCYLPIGVNVCGCLSFYVWPVINRWLVRVSAVIGFNPLTSTPASTSKHTQIRPLDQHLKLDDDRVNRT